MKNLIFPLLFLLSLSVVVGLYLHIQSLNKSIDRYLADFQDKVFFENIIKNLIEKEISQHKVSGMELKGNPQILNKLKELCKNATIFITPEKLEHIQKRLDNGQSANSIAKKEDISRGAIRNAGKSGKLIIKHKKP
ncbi:MAG: hypothetical protein LBE13_01085 [Bacteroidales bacterium]|jgi:guanylate kinase|nr:hypothetical protein [Bacteroidales bacterium]